MSQVSAASLKKIGNGVYAWIGVNGDSNAGAVETPDGLLAIDAQQSRRLGGDFRVTLETKLARPVCQLINSHFHLDHTAGNVAFTGIPIIAHKRTYDILAQSLGELEMGAWTITAVEEKLKLFFGSNIHDLIPSGDPCEAWFIKRLGGPDYETIELRPPDQMFEDRWYLPLRGETLRAEYWGPAHSDGDLIVHLPKEKVVFLGDLLFVGRFPWFGDCDLDGWIAILDRVLALDVTTVVPGHGDVTTLHAVEVFRDLLSALRDAVAAAIRAGHSEEAAVRDVALPAFSILPRYHEWMPFNVRSAYRYLKSR